MAQPLLSIGMIVKNEERSLEKCLKALEPLRQAIPCELVIADTGSTDKTKEIAAKYADILFDFVWVNDFSAARNAVMDKCSGKWYLTVDADEYLAPDIDELVKFLTSKAADNMKEATIIQRNHFTKNMTGKYSDFNAKRMCRMDTGTRYTSTIHEYFNLPVTYDEIYILNNTILDHDGYAHISPEHKAQKEARNLELLKKKLEDDPDNLRVILQCLESSAFNESNRRYYTKYAIEKLKKASHSDKYWDSAAANCAKQIALYLNQDNDPFIEEWLDWTFKTFPKSEHITVDTKYIHTKYLFSNEKYIECIKSGKEYLKNLAERKKQNNVATLDKITVTLLHAHEYHKNEIQIIIADAMIKENRESEAVKLLTESNLCNQDEKIISDWFVVISHLNKIENSVSHISKYLSTTLDKAKNDASDAYNIILNKITTLFSVTSKNKAFLLFAEISGAIGLSVKIADAKTKAEAEMLLTQIENWEEFMPLALKQTILLKADLPKEFYLMTSARLSLLINNLSEASDEIAEALPEKYCTLEYCNEFPRTSFIFNLLLTILFNNGISLSNELKVKLTNNFIVIADNYLISCYNPELLKNEEYVVCLPALHLFAWYLVKATKEKEQNPLQYIKTLRVALKKIPQARQLVEFLIEEFRKEEESKKQEQLKNASPELVALAEQLKVMLRAFAPNDPQLLAIKQSPMYKQVAFLIEN